MKHSLEVPHVTDVMAAPSQGERSRPASAPEPGGSATPAVSCCGDHRPHGACSSGIYAHFQTVSSFKQLCKIPMKRSEFHTVIRTEEPG